MHQLFPWLLLLRLLVLKLIWLFHFLIIPYLSRPFILLLLFQPMLLFFVHHQMLIIKLLTPLYFFLTINVLLRHQQPLISLVLINFLNLIQLIISLLKHFHNPIWQLQFFIIMLLFLAIIMLTFIFIYVLNFLLFSQQL